MESLYDPEADAFYLRFADSRIVESEKIIDGVVFDLDAHGRIVAIEFLDVSERLAKGAV